MADSGGKTEDHTSVLFDSAQYEFPGLMPRRVRRVLLVASPYDAFVLDEGGLLAELITSEFMELGLTEAPVVTCVADREHALEVMGAGSVDLVITTLSAAGTDILRFRDEARQLAADLPFVLLLPNEAELARLGDRRAELDVVGTYAWQGDPKLFPAIIQAVEDEWNVAHDTLAAGVGVFLLLEPSLRYRSTLLPILYAELVQQTRRVMRDGLNNMQRLLRTRARPKVLLTSDCRQAQQRYQQYGDLLVGILADTGGAGHAKATADVVGFICTVHAEHGAVPALLHSANADDRAVADSIGVAFLNKESPTLVQDVQSQMIAVFGFGDFVFHNEAEEEVARATDVPGLRATLERVENSVLRHHAPRHSFSTWLRARGDFALAAKVREHESVHASEPIELREGLLAAFREVSHAQQRGIVQIFDPQRFDRSTMFARIGGGSIGGKARGLVFLDRQFAARGLEHAFDGVRVMVPRSVVIGTDVYDRFLEQNGLCNAAHTVTDTDEEIRTRFLAAELPADVVEDLQTYLQVVRVPIAVRSSSLLEDSQYHPFAGVYDTHMLTNNDADDAVRLQKLQTTIKVVYASVFFETARQYLEATNHRADQQKMAVILQEVVGTRHDHYFYPSMSGVARTHNYYPFPQMQPQDGIVMTALGLGEYIVEGGATLWFCPKYPQVTPQIDVGEAFLDQSQQHFLALDLDRSKSDASTLDQPAVVRLEVAAAEKHGTLDPIGSVWNRDSATFCPGMHRAGPRAVTFAHMLGYDAFPFADILDSVLDAGREGMAMPVEMEFAVNLMSQPKEVVVVQMRPYGIGTGDVTVEIEEAPDKALLLRSNAVLGNGVIADIQDVVYVRQDTFDNAKMKQIAAGVARLNDQLREEQRPYLLVGHGRWGSSDHWLGIPVTWGQISGAKIIVEAARGDFPVDPSQGSHFFHNLTTIGVAYVTVNPMMGSGFVDWDWLDRQAAAHDDELIRHVRLPTPLEARVDGRSSRALIYKRGDVNQARSASTRPA